MHKNSLQCKLFMLKTILQNTWDLGQEKREDIIHAR